ncbi:sodium-dependent nutrient amino acid transporter 1 isoform X1 [Rhagoletis pomonella]|uniref:sodium-dependent nutrient amino acid transporter 1 isoform X1 n=1 Tax=Rhagoletis pomonella TaxID=28610 RepID=UPI00177B382D|nr:sodium-dependent nutrient amino acid transporter 1 isoform X1 [Rhagoletis pomonella]XP_036334374.1 sodium-dependent nutrient amino acid transporter 1 isoform X1 [Rhagoletis pomonella]XP_036334376.1 sodium-dependent nutrient amino acid transporter 1 isoform X1 [Rhagoletis pomonella]XP_036334377.1 sodium-dependent nutrient amino acid transporter 1 isoform X1 [Rhagoletis pomonella]XP_036334378.1 sodium-dependent nutrient amino acid transporter 1 isoform X1 [Rhagoletis pomonella]XP_036334379.1 
MPKAQFNKFVADEADPLHPENSLHTNIERVKHDEASTSQVVISSVAEDILPASGGERDKWSREIEFLFSCIALSVGLGNVWRFPFIALENGGGAFVIPYVIVLLLIGRPIYYMEVLIGQFASRGAVKVFDMAPIMKGIAYGQVYATALATTYYAAIMALTIKYLLASFTPLLPWATCQPEWGANCASITTYNSSVIGNTSHEKLVSSAELYFTKVVLREKDNIEDGIGTPSLDLVIYLFLVWVLIAVTLIKGIQSSGKASYFLALFPYVVLFTLLGRALTLPGAWDGIVYFLKPQWDQLLNPEVWYAAITQMFFSLAICFGTLIMYASYNNFHKRVHKDVMIVTTIDSFTSILAGCVIFGILGNLALETNNTDISKVVKGGTGLAFISYPEAIAKFKYLPQFFAVLFFFMLLVLGIGSNIGMSSCVITVFKDRFDHIPQWVITIGFAICSFLCGLIYTTPGGQYLLNLVDFFGCSFIALFLAIGEIVTISWIYGVKRFCKDIEFMCNLKTGFYWRICWAIFTPGLLFLVLVYTLINYKPLEYKGMEYPEYIYNIAWLIWLIGVGQLPFWALYTVYKQPGNTFMQKFNQAIKPKSNWGPASAEQLEKYILFMKNSQNHNPEHGWTSRIYDNIFG